MTEIYILAVALVACGVYINYLTWRMGKLAAHLESQSVVMRAMMSELGDLDDNN